MGRGQTNLRRLSGVSQESMDNARRLSAAGRTFALPQTADSGLVGTSLWDSAVLLVRYLDQEAVRCLTLPYLT